MVACSYCHHREKRANMINSKVKRQKLISSLTNIGALAGTNDIGVAGGIEGLGLSAAQVLCDNETKTVRDGLFKVAVIGTWACGKTTLINALLGKNFLPTFVLPSSFFHIHVRYGDKEDEEWVDVYMKDEIKSDGNTENGECVRMRKDEFEKEYCTYTSGDEKELRETGRIVRFEKVAYVVMYCSSPLLAEGVTFIDAPALTAKESDMLRVMYTAREAQAVIYVLNNHGLFMHDKDFIERTFEHGSNKIFFVVNRFDLIREEEQAIILEYLKIRTESIFTTEERVDTNLQCHRLFGISALRALEARTGMRYDYDDMPLIRSERKALLDKSGIEPFEQELKRYLATDDKCRLQYQRCFEVMASVYHDVEERLEQCDFILQECKKQEQAISVAKFEKYRKHVAAVLEAIFKEAAGAYYVVFGKTMTLQALGINK